VQDHVVYFFHFSGCKVKHFLRSRTTKGKTREIIDNGQLTIDNYSFANNSQLSTLNSQLSVP
jgi:hypothetical protein